MSDIAIKVENLSKKYTIGLAQQKHDTLRDLLVDAVRAPFRNNGKARQEQSTLWALKDVSFEVKRGEVVGIIGRNGAGKSTLLKILSRITEPTSGRAIINGRVGSLLEVGTGFHPELTGRENIYLNGAILGMRRSEIERRFDEIVAFSEIEKFLDTPVKRYSSGMYVRLAFAVAAHMEPEILLVDEVLAVGDAAFQNKCLGKMGNVAQEGRTVIFVSHNMGVIEQLCKHCILLGNGKLLEYDLSDKVIKKYINSLQSNETNWQRAGTQRVKIEQIKVENENGNEMNTFLMGDDIFLSLSGKSEEGGTEFSISVQFCTDTGVNVLYCYDQFLTIKTDSSREFRIRIKIHQIRLMPGTYYLSFWIGRSGMEHFDFIKMAKKIEIIQSEFLLVTHSLTNSHGLVYGSYEISQLNSDGSNAT